MTETRLRWVGYVQRRPLRAPVKKIDQMIFSSMRRDRGRSKTILGEVIKRDICINGIPKSLIWDRKKWRHLIHVADLT